MYQYSHIEYYEMVRAYLLSNECLLAARRMYEAECLRRIRAKGVPNPPIPGNRTILHANQNLQEFGQFRSPFSRGCHHNDLTVKREDQVVEFYLRNPLSSSGDAVERFGITKTAALRLQKEPEVRKARVNMGKDDKTTMFSFKDKEKAEETLRLLEQHDANYRRLTVRGLLGRAKRVLSITKAEEKIKNIKEAIQVFEDWLADLEKNKEKKNNEREQRKRDKAEKEKKSQDEEENSSSDVEMEETPAPKKELPADTVPGLGFKDKEAAENTLKELEGRDPDYQKLAVKGLIGRAKRVLTCTKDETKLSNIKQAIGIFDKFLDDFDSMHLSKQNNPYVSLGIVRTCVELAGDNISEQQKSFISAYTLCGGEYKRLRTVPSDSGKTWDIVRNAALKELKEKHSDAKLFTDKDEPTPEHLEMLLWAYSPEAARVKKVIKESKEEKEVKTESSEEKESEKESSGDRESRKRKSSANDESPNKKKKE